MIKNRKILIVNGIDAENFLQRLLTNDIRKIDNKLQYNLLLSPQGKLLHDIFILKVAEEYWLDCHDKAIEDIVEIFTKYRLGSKVEFSIKDGIYVNNSPNGYPDPRHEKLQYRDYSDASIHEKDNYDMYYELSLARLYIDFESGKYFPFEVGFDKFNAISYTKGCYVGQEVITRTHHRGVIRKKIYKITSDRNLTPNSNILIDNKKIGIILGIYGEGKALALLNSELVTDNLTLSDGSLIKIIPAKNRNLSELIKF